MNELEKLIKKCTDLEVNRFVKSVKDNAGQRKTVLDALSTKIQEAYKGIIDLKNESEVIRLEIQDLLDDTYHLKDNADLVESKMTTYMVIMKGIENLLHNLAWKKDDSISLYLPTVISAYLSKVSMARLSDLSDTELKKRINELEKEMNDNQGE